MSDSWPPFRRSPPGCPWNFPGKNTGVGCHFLLQGIFLTQGSNPLFLCLLHCGDSLPAEPLGEAPKSTILQSKKREKNQELALSPATPFHVSQWDGVGATAPAPPHRAGCVPGSALRPPSQPPSHPPKHGHGVHLADEEGRAQTSEASGLRWQSRSPDRENAHSGWSASKGHLTVPPSKVLPKARTSDPKAKSLRQHVVTAGEPGNGTKPAEGRWGCGVNPSL